MKFLSGKTAFVTGGASGLGFAIAKKCINENMNVIIADIEEVELKKSEEILKKGSSRVLSIICDISDEKSVINAKDKALKEFGEVNILFNNAGISAGSFIWETTKNDWDWIINVNIYGLINTLRTFVPVMLNQKNECHIVNTASVAGLITSPGNGPYSMTKSAIISISETLFAELQMMKANIGVSIICPGFIKTRIYEAERNRPENMKNKNVSDAYQKMQVALTDFLKPAVQNGLDPEVIVDKIFKGIKTNKLYVAIPKEVEKQFMERSDKLFDEMTTT